MSIAEKLSEIDDKDTLEIIDEKGNVLPRADIERIIRETAWEVTQEALTENSPVRDVEDESLEAISDRISELTWQQVQQLVAGVLRAMGYKTRIFYSRDRNRDIVATIDGVGLAGTTIVVEVKHQIESKSKVSAPKIRQFIPVLRRGQRGMYVSTTGFITEALYEAERADSEIVTIDRRFLITLILENYDRFDEETRALLPLKRVYWPIE